MADKRTPSLDGLIQTKGAPRPDTLVQRIEAQSPARVLQDEQSWLGIFEQVG